MPLDFNSGEYLENFFVWAIASVLIIRSFLSLTGYPQIGTSNIHIAHMLFGGFFMLIAIFILLVFLTSRIKILPCILGGIGFGFFIDELGKFITQDNNYFYKPTFSIIYVIFVLIFLFIKYLENSLELEKKDYLANAIDIIEYGAVNGISNSDRKQALYYLSKTHADGAVIDNLKNIIDSLNEIDENKKSPIIRAKDKITNLCLRLVRHKKFAKILIVFFVFIIISKFIDILLGFHPHLSFWELGVVFSNILATVLILLGIYNLMKNKTLKAYEFFRYSVLISIFLTQFFLFYNKQLLALINLFFNIIILLALQFLISQEKLSVHTD